MTAPDMSALSKEMQDNLQKIDFGLQVQAFLKSRIGQYLQDRAVEEVEEYTQALKNHPILTDPAGAAVIQMNLKASEKFLYWLGNAVHEGAELMKLMLAEERQALGIGEVVSPGGDATGS